MRVSHNEEVCRGYENAKQTSKRICLAQASLIEIACLCNRWSTLIAPAPSGMQSSDMTVCDGRCSDKQRIDQRTANRWIFDHRCRHATHIEFKHPAKYTLTNYRTLLVSFRYFSRVPDNVSVVNGAFRDFCQERLQMSLSRLHGRRLGPLPGNLLI